MILFNYLALFTMTAILAICLSFCMFNKTAFYSNESRIVAISFGVVFLTGNMQDMGLIGISQFNTQMIILAACGAGLISVLVNKYRKDKPITTPKEKNHEEKHFQII